MYGRVTDIADNEGYAHFYKMTPAAEDLSQPGVSPAMRNKLQLQSDLQKTTINYAFDLLGYFWTGTDVEGTPAAGSYANRTDNTTRFINRASHRSSINNLNGTSRMFVYSCGEVILEPGTYTFSAYVQTNFSGNSQNPDGGAKMQVDLGGWSDRDGGADYPQGHRLDETERHLHGAEHPHCADAGGNRGPGRHGLVQWAAD